MRVKTDYPGIVFREVDRIGGKGKEKMFYVRYKKAGKVYEEKAGRQYADDMTAARAARIRGELIEGKRVSRPEKKAAKQAVTDRWTFSKLWEEYGKHRTNPTSLKVDEFRFNKHIKPIFGDKEPSELKKLDVDRLRISLLKNLSPQTVVHSLGLLKWISNFGVEKQLCKGFDFKVKMPLVDNQSTENLTSVQLQSLLTAMEQSTDIEAVGFMKMALFTGMRRGELMKLEWSDVDFDRGFITICHDPKGGKSQTIPLNHQARDVLENHPKKEKAINVFVRANGKPFTSVINERVRAIRDAAGLPASFRPLHGLRHCFASMLASSGQVDMYTLQKLLTHKSPLMTQRYAHLADESLRRASNLVGELMKKKEDDTDKAQEAS